MESTFVLLRRGASEVPDMFEGKTKDPAVGVCIRKLEVAQEHLQMNYQRVKEVRNSEFVKWLNEKARGGTLARLGETDKKVWVLPLIRNGGLTLILSLDKMEVVNIPSPTIRLKVVVQRFRTKPGAPHIHFESMDTWSDHIIAAALDQFAESMSTVKFIYSILENDAQPIIE